MPRRLVLPLLGLLRAPLVLALAAAPLACGDSGPSRAPAVTSSLTYADVAPILHGKCVKCHQAGGIAPFALDSFAAASARAGAIATATKAGTMPPFLVTHDGTCGSFDDAEALTPAELQKIQAWAAAPSVEGPPLALAPAAPLGLETGTDVSTPKFSPAPQGGALAEADEYRCFPIDAGRERDAFITAYDVIPGNAPLVHHAVAFLVDPKKVTASGKSNGEVMKALDDQSPDRLGWPCFGLAGDGVEVSSVPVIWAPGQGPVRYPGGVGVRHRKDDQLVVQIHYNLSDPALRGQNDTTKLRFQYADRVDRRAEFVLDDGFLDTLGKPQPDVLLPGKPSVEYTWKKSVAQLGLGQLPFVDLIGVMPHMHQRGRRKEMRIRMPGGASQCAARVENWDFEWQKFYFYKAPPRLTPASEIELTCDYDTSRETAPVLPGWGTRNEMCIAILMLALPPGI